MNLIKTALEGVFIIEPQVFHDARGFFFESYNQNAFNKLGLNYSFVQDNQSFSSFGTVRGIHFQKGDAAQAKLVSVAVGKILDVVVDLRIGSSTFGKHISVVLSDENHRQLMIPRGFGHGFSVLSETALFTYKCDNFYAPKEESGVCFDDVDLAIDWQVDMKKIILNERDKKLPTLAQYIKSPAFFYSQNHG